MKDNKGITLVELIIVIALICVIGTGTFLTMNSLKGVNVSKASSLIYDEIISTRVETMSKVDKTYLYIYKNTNDANYYIYSSSINSLNKVQLDAVTSSPKIGNKGIMISYKKNTDLPSDDETYLDNTNFILIYFNRSTGAFESDYSIITVGNGADNEKTIRMIKETGKIYYE
jgi:prepilin-type N-terminal cleavage/methylation domain-containing protein